MKQVVNIVIQSIIIVVFLVTSLITTNLPTKAQSVLSYIQIIFNFSVDKNYNIKILSINIYYNSKHTFIISFYHNYTSF